MTVEFSKEEWLSMFRELNERISKLEEYINNCKEGQKIFEDLMSEVQFEGERPKLKPWEGK